MQAIASVVMAMTALRFKLIGHMSMVLSALWMSCRSAQFRHLGLLVGHDTRTPWLPPDVLKMRVSTSTSRTTKLNSHT